VLLDPEIFLDLSWPADMRGMFEDLVIKTAVMATSYTDRGEIVFRSGPLAPAVAGSMAIPGLFRPVEMEDRLLIDGGAVNPLPCDLLFDNADIVVAFDVTFGGSSQSKRLPWPVESMFGAAQIMQGAIATQKLKRRRPDVLVRPPVEQFGLLDFFRAGQVLRAAESANSELKDALSAHIRCISFYLI
jgi:NTE family protein